MAVSEEAGQLLTTLREKHGRTMVELAEEAGVSATTIANYERGTRSNGDPFKPSSRILRKIAKAFPVDEGRLITEAFGLPSESSNAVGEQPENEAEPDATSGSVADPYLPILAAGDHLEVLGWLGDDGDVLLVRDPAGRMRLWIERTQVIADTVKGL